jgi:hypothetical protein
MEFWEIIIVYSENYIERKNGIVNKLRLDVVRKPTNELK